MTPIRLIVARVLARLKAHIVQPDPESEPMGGPEHPSLRVSEAMRIEARHHNP